MCCCGILVRILNIKMLCRCSLLRGDPGLSLLKTWFWAMGWGDGLDMYPQLEDGFGFMRAMLLMWPILWCRTSKSDEMWSSYAIQSWGISGVLAYFGLKIFLELWTSTLFCLSFIIILILSKPICNSIVPKLTISSYIFQWICLKLSESMYNGFRKRTFFLDFRLTLFWKPKSKMVNLVPIDFQTSSPLNINVNNGQNKFEDHLQNFRQNGLFSAQNRPRRHFCPTFELA